MIAEVIAIGDELTSGQRLDTNSQWLSQRLNAMGVRVLYHTTVGDDFEANVSIFRQAAERAELVVTTGGLGPTADDLTREALAEVVGVELVEDAASLRHIEGVFHGRGRTMPERNRLQALFPAGSLPVPNPTGTAPGIAVKIARQGDDRFCQLFALPGVPREMHVMWEETVSPAIEQLLPERLVTLHRKILCFGAGESHIESMLPDLIRRGREPQVGITASSATITLRVTATGKDQQACLARMEPTLQQIRQSLGDLIFGEDDDELHDLVIKQLRERRLRVATVEWGSGGTLSQLLEEYEVHEPRLAGGAVLGGLDLPHPLLGSDSGTVLDKNGALQLARAAREKFAASVGVSLLVPKTVRFDVGDGGRGARGFWALSFPEGEQSGKFVLLADHELNQVRAAKIALNELRKSLIQASTIGIEP